MKFIAEVEFEIKAPSENAYWAEMYLVSKIEDALSFEFGNRYKILEVNRGNECHCDMHTKEA